MGNHKGNEGHRLSEQNSEQNKLNNEKKSAHQAFQERTVGGMKMRMKMKKISAKIFQGFTASLIVLSAALMGSGAEARDKRVMVFMKEQSSFSQVQNHFSKYGTQNLKNGVRLGNPVPQALAQVNGSIQSTLKNIQGVLMTIASDADIEKLRQNPAVDFVDLEVMHPAPRPIVGAAAMMSYRKLFDTDPIDEATTLFAPSTGTPWGIAAVKAVEAWPAAHYGSGARVLVLDTGIDKDHPSLKANLEVGKAFVDPYGLPYEYFDDVGHGTHVSGTILGAMDSTGFTGVAPKAKLLMGKVCVPEGCSNFSVAQGIEWGILQKVDVISMSLGGPQATPTERRAVSKAASAGVTIVAATGNDGIPQVSFPAALPTVIAVGAINSSLARADFSQWGPELAVVAPGVDVVSSVPTGTGRTPMVQVQMGDQEAHQIPSSFIDGSKTLSEPLSREIIDVGYGREDEFAKIDASGKFALVKRGDNKFMDKIKWALKAKVAGLIVANDVPGLLHGTISQDGSEIEFPLFVIEKTSGEALSAALASGLLVKGQLAVTKSDYSSFDGTSMATPHVAGVVALIKATNKKLTPAQVKKILQSTATPLTPNNQNQLGAGLVQADKAVIMASQPDPAGPTDPIDSN